MSGVQGSILIWRKKHRHYSESVCIWKEKKNTHRCFNNPPSAHSKGKKRGGPKWNFYRLRKWIMGRVAWIKTDQFLRWQLVFFASISRREAEAEKRRNRKKGGRGTKGEAESERESERKGEWGRGGTQRGKWCSKKPASTLDWNLKVPDSIPGSTLREIIHPKTTSYFGVMGDRFDLKLIPDFNGSTPVFD